MTATGNLLGTAVSGLLAYQRAMATTGHNVSNVNTPGFSRQSVELATQMPLFSGGGFVGTGVNVNSVSRAYDQFLTTTLRTTTSGQSEFGAYYALSKQIDNVVADPQAGLSPALQDFFNAVHTVSTDPSSTTARQVMLSQANSLANRFHFLNDRLDNLQASANTQVQATVVQINTLGHSIAQLNQQIADLQGLAAGKVPNDLLDQRDEAIRQLAELVSVSVVPQDNGALNVFIGNGQSLVLSNQSATLNVMQNKFDPANFDVGFSFNGGGVMNITQNLTGGKLGGAIGFRDGLLKNTVDQLGRVAVGLSEVFNAQHQLGLNQSNTPGGNFFTDLGTQQAIASRNNNALTNITFTGDVTDVGALKASDYRIDFNAGNYTMTRVSDNTIVGVSAVPTFNLTATEGFNVSAAGAVVNNGDSFLLSMTANAARDTGVVVTQSTQIAAAAPLRTRTAITNTGNGTITQGDVSNTSNVPLAGSITMTFDSSIPGFTVVGGPGGPLAYNPATESAGKSFTFAGYGGFTFRVLAYRSTATNLWSRTTPAGPATIATLWRWPH